MRLLAREVDFCPIPKSPVHHRYMEVREQVLSGEAPPERLHEALAFSRAARQKERAATLQRHGSPERL